MNTTQRIADLTAERDRLLIRHAELIVERDKQTMECNALKNVCKNWDHLSREQIREITRLRTLAVDLAGALKHYYVDDDYDGAFETCDCRVCKTRRALTKARKEGVIE